MKLIDRSHFKNEKRGPLTTRSMVEAQIHKKKCNVTHFVTLHWTYSRKEMGEAFVERKKIGRYQLGFLDTWGRGAQRHYRSAPSTPVEICNAPWHFLPCSYFVLNSVGIIPFQFICLKICCKTVAYFEKYKQVSEYIVASYQNILMQDQM